MSASLSLQNGVDVGSDDALDRRYEVADNATRDLLITQEKIKVGRVILHTGDNQHYKLKTYPTPGSLTGVVWEPFGEGESLSDADVKSKYENNANTNAFTDAEKSKLASIDATHYLPPVQSLVALRAITEASLTDKARVYVEDESSDYFYDAQAVSGDEQPDDQTGGTGFWKKVSAGGESAASIKTKYESNADTNAFTDAEKSKLSGIATGATANQTDAHLKDRANHTGTQARNTITNTKGADIDHNASGALALNLGGFDHLDVTVSDNITSMPITNGIDNNSYEVRLKCSADVTVKLAPDWLKNTAYVIGDERVFKDLNNEYVDYQVYECTTAHTSDNTGTYGDFTNDSANWQLKVRRPGKNPIKLNSDGETDVAIITKEGTVSGVETYRLEMKYA